MAESSSPFLVVHLAIDCRCLRARACKRSLSRRNLRFGVLLFIITDSRKAPLGFDLILGMLWPQHTLISFDRAHAFVEKALNAGARICFSNIQIAL